MTAALGFGVSGPHGQAWFTEKKLARLIAQAIDGGVRHFDTAPFYGDAEARLGRALKAVRARDIIVSTKTGTRRRGWTHVKDFAAKAIRDDVESSLRRLNCGALDVLYLHGPTIAEIDAAIPALLALKAEGKVKAIGVCGQGAELDHAVLRGFDAIMGVYNVLDRRHARVFALAKSKGVQTTAIAPLAQGAFADRKLELTLSGIWGLARGTMRAGPPDDLVDAARRTLSGIEGFDPTGAALAFVLQGGAANLALTTTSNPVHLEQALAAARRALDPATMARLSAFSLDPAGGRS